MYLYIYTEEHKSVLRVYSRCVYGYTHSVIAESVFRRLTDLGKQWTFDCSRFSAGLLPSNPNSRYRVAQWRGCVSICIHKLRETFPIFRQVQFQTGLDFTKSCSWLLPIMNTVNLDGNSKVAIAIAEKSMWLDYIKKINLIEIHQWCTLF